MPNNIKWCQLFKLITTNDPLRYIIVFPLLKFTQVYIYEKLYINYYSQKENFKETMERMKTAIETKRKMEQNKGVNTFFSDIKYQ